MLERLLDLLHRRRFLVLALALGAAGLAGSFLPSLRLDDSPERWLPASVRDSWARFSEHFQYGDTIVVGLELHRPVREDDLSFLTSLREDLERVPTMLRVMDPSFLAREVERVPIVELLADPQPGSPDRFGVYRGVLFDDPALWRSDAGPDANGGRTLLFVLETDPEPDGVSDPRERQRALRERRHEAVSRVYSVLDGHRREDVTFHVIGGTVIEYELERIAGRMLATLVPISLVFTILAIGIGFRSLTAAGIALLGGAWSMTVLLGGVAALGWSIDVVTAGGPPLMAVIVVATTVHFAHHYSQRPRGTAPGDRPEERRKFILWVAVPCLGAALAAAVGFLMQSFHELGPAREFGIELFFGALLAFLGAFLAWLFLHPFRAARGRWLSRERLDRAHRAIVARPALTVGTIVAASVVLCLSALLVQLDADPFSFFQPGSRVARALRHLTERRFGHYILDMVLVPKHRPDDPAARDAARAADLERARQFERRIRERPEVRNSISSLALAAKLPSLQTLGSDLRRVLAFHRMFLNWTEDRSQRDAIRITFTVSDPGHGFSPLMEAVRHAAPSDRFDCIYAGSVACVVALTEGMLGGMSSGLWVAAALMALLCYCLFRSARLTVLAFLPNAFPIVFVFGFMGLAGIPLNSGSAMVATIALGMALNDTVHFLMDYRRRREEGRPVRDAVADTFGELGRPLILTSAVNCAGFAIFLLSDFRPMFDFGLLASISMVAALVGDMVLLPNLLHLFDRGGRTAS